MPRPTRDEDHGLPPDDDTFDEEDLLDDETSEVGDDPEADVDTDEKPAWREAAGYPPASRAPSTYEGDDEEGPDFADPGGRSALRAAGRGNLRNLPCPTCRQPNCLTPADRRLGYQCDACADRAERGGDF